jgi:hypothetical protein
MAHFLVGEWVVIFSRAIPLHDYYSDSGVTPNKILFRIFMEGSCIVVQ